MADRFDLLRGNRVFGVTDDLLYARALILRDVEKTCGSHITNVTVKKFEEAFTTYQQGLIHPRIKFNFFHVSFGDYHYKIRESQLIVAVGGMSTIENIYD